MKRPPIDYILGFAGIVSGWSLILFLAGMYFHSSRYFEFTMLIVFVLGLVPLGAAWLVTLLYEFSRTALPSLGPIMRWLTRPIEQAPRSAFSSVD